MAKGPTIDFRTLRPHHHDRKLAFEELMRQLLVADPPAGCLRFEHKGPGADGGVETLAYLADGSCWGYQSKFFLDQFGASEMNQISGSFRAALAAYPALSRFVVAVPRNLSGGVKANALSQQQRWSRWAEAAGDEAKALGRTVAIELWDETRFVAALSRRDPIHAGIRQYWFDSETLDQAWFADRFATNRADLNARYNPAHHVDVSAQWALDTLSRNTAYRATVASHLEAHAEARSTFETLAATVGDQRDSALYSALDASLAAAAAAGSALGFFGSRPVDFEPLRKALDHLVLTEGLQSPSDFRLQREASAAVDPEPHWGTQERRQAWFAYREALERLVETADEIDQETLVLPRVMLVGEAGAGKSHSLAHLVETHLADGGAAVMALGQHFVSGDPRSQWLDRLGLGGLTFTDFLGALQAAAGATGMPGLIVIDAINESHDFSMWQKNLAGLVDEISRFDQLAFVISCRETYEGACVPEGLAMVRREHHGFAGNASAAIKAYFDDHGIDRPSAPFLDSAFANPLFLSVCIRRLNAEGRRAFPLGLDGATELFNFWIDGVERVLVGRNYARLALGDGRLREAMRRFSSQLAIEGVSALPMARAKALLEEAVADIAPATARDILLFRLLDEGVLRREIDRAGVESVTITFQRFSDYFIADALIDMTGSAPSLAAALRPGGSLHYLVSRGAGRYAGVVETLMARTPERLGLELVELDADFPRDVPFRLDVFLSSLRWRAPAAVSTRTVQLFELQWARTEGRRADLLNLLIQVSTVPDHPLNADYLHARLRDLPLPERDGLIADYLIRHMVEGPIETLMDWAAEARTDLAEPERVRLALVVIAWVTASSNRIVRDSASKTLTAVLSRSPRLMAGLIDAFSGVDDAYVRERIYAAVLATATHAEVELEALRRAAIAAWRDVFSRSPVERHAFIRHHAKGLVELAAARGVLADEIELARARPPYASIPIEQWPEASDLAAFVDTAPDIVSSVVGYYDAEEGRFSTPGDFGNYTMSTLGHSFCAEPRTEAPPQTRGQVAKAFWSGLQMQGGKLAALASKAISAHATLQEAQSRRPLKYFPLDLESDDPPADADLESLADSFDVANAALREALPKGASWPPYPDHRADDYPLFSKSRARLWAARRAIELGWTADRHKELEERMSYWGGRDKHALERIGKKYQWIAFHELIGALQDHYWSVADDGAPEVLTNVLRVEELDIDLSYAATGAASLPPGLPSIGIPQTDRPEPSSIEEALTWARAPTDIPHVPDLVEALAVDGARWWLIYGTQRDRGYMDKLQAVGPMRTSQGSIQLVIVHKAEITTLHERLSAGRLNAVEMMEAGHYQDDLFGQYRSELAGDETPLTRRARKIDYGFVSRRFSPHRGEYDHSGVKEIGFEIPRPWILRGLDLRPAGPDAPWYVDRHGRPVFVDRSTIDGTVGTPMINADLLEPLLAELGYLAAWLYWGEKDGGVGSGKGFSRRDGPFARETYCGLWWRSEASWQGSLWKADGDKLHPWIDDE